MLLLFQSVFPVALLYILKLIVDALSNVKEDGFDEILVFIIAYGAVSLVNAAFGNLSQLASEAQQQKVSDFMALLIQKKNIEIDLEYFESPKFLNTFHRAQRQGLYKPVQILNSLSSLIQNTVSLLAISGLLIYLQWYVLLIIVVATIPKIIVRLVFSKKLYDWEIETTQKQRESNYLNNILTDEANAKELRIFDYGMFFSNKFSVLRKELFKGKLKINKLKFWITLIATTGEVIASTAAYGIIAWNTYKGVFSVGDLVLYIQAYQKAQNLFVAQLSDVVKLRENHFFINDLFSFLNVPSKMKAIQPLQPTPVDIKDHIKFNQVSFAYPEQSQKVLKKISMTFKKGEVTALVGANGSGKTTAVKLLSRLYDPESGQIEIDGTNIKQLSINEWRQKISIIFQDFSRYFLSVSENIRMSNTKEAIDNERLILSSKKSGADTYIEKLDGKYNNLLGKRFKNGTELSGGQWQKLALSRAFYKDAEILIFDEPTSAIDPLAEHEIFTKLKKLAKDKVILLVTHRLYNLKLADKIYLMSDGELLEEGSHQQLIEKKGIYKQMFEKQS